MKRGASDMASNDSPAAKQAKTGSEVAFVTAANPIHFSVFNATDKLLGRAWELTLNYTEIGASGPGMSNTDRFPPQEWTNSTVPSFGDKKVDAKSCFLEIQKEGLEFEGGAKKVFLEEGGKYTVQLSAGCPPLKEAEYAKARDLLLDLCEGFGPVAPTDDDEDKVWPWIVGALGRPTDPDNVKKVSRMIRDGSASGDGRTRCRQRMETHPRKPVVDSATVATADVKKALATNAATIVIYHRALDRFPGGNSDQHVIKHKIDLAKSTLEILHWFDWDGSSEMTTKPTVLDFAKKKKTIDEKLVPALNALLDVAGPREVSWTIKDEQSDSDEYDTEWSSIEFLVYLDSDCTNLVARFHQFAIYTNWYGFMGQGDKDHPEVPATELQTALIEATQKLTKLERVEAFSEDTGFIAEDGDYKGVNDLGYVNPIYLK